ncbi:MAG: transcriptional repressor LexA [Peptoniphilus lacydonensis]|uniref:transcriptional repressor LexA n=1 Tax=Peptoniphilus TaxID=162289 RepID=UPI0008D8FD99|nr:MULTISPECIES: transcriptional repressor LexA [Peptoniphilus]MDU1954213.1 transcriptional repressor LexA [Peptoniphilus lacydonensis]MDU2115572.1 transcriptional repressor LexA [Peptoniphilus lacydonensis]MDU5274611.1 transcriptional repressor LexA [Peptoniphilus lacydonensis]MDU5595523.1 transcriptional repressor LexA [Peptoniphilus rhinitidis]MDU7301746.1 transcriptional repressor LexA [Peptoniphilus lacydonensis]
MYEDLNQRELEILFFIKRFIESKSYPPTVREICSGCNIKSTSTVYYALEKLESTNYIKKDASKTRAIEIVPQDDDILMLKKKTVDVPIVGKVTAGAPILAVQNIEDTMPLPIEFATDKELFILKVSGESMINAGIFDGDYVIIEKCNSARNGEKVLALIDDEATIKTYYKEKNRFRLQPENDSMEPLYFDKIDILGKIVGLYRKIN